MSAERQSGAERSNAELEPDASPAFHQLARDHAPDLCADLAVSRRRVAAEQMWKAYAAEIFCSFGLDLNPPGTLETVHRFIKALSDATAGYDWDPMLS